MTSPPPAPKFCKRVHHVVPASWQRRFAFPGDVGPFYKNVLSGSVSGPEGPGNKMSEEYANIVFDSYYRPSDKLEDSLGLIETKAMPLFDRMIATSVLTSSDRIDLAYFLAVQACRYPEQFARRLDLGRFLAIALKDASTMSGAAEMNAYLQEGSFLPGANLSDADLQRLKEAPTHALAAELDAILTAHGYEEFFNPELIVAGARPIAEVLLAFQWDLVKTKDPSFILSDRPMPTKLGDGFSLGLSSNFGVFVRQPVGPVHEGTISSRPATEAETRAINSEARGRAREWICGPGNWISTL